MNEKAAVLIDNYYLKKEVLGNLQGRFRLDYKKFSELLCGKENSDHYRTYVYDCEFKSNENLLKSVERLPNFEVSYGNKQKQGQHYVQKQVDIMLAVDMIKLAQKGIQKIILVSGDSDFIPAIKYVKDNNLTSVILWTARKDYKGDLATACDVSNPLTDEVLIAYAKP